jgi:hypothetical protein
LEGVVAATDGLRDASGVRVVVFTVFYLTQDELMEVAAVSGDGASPARVRGTVPVGGGSSSR